MSQAFSPCTSSRLALPARAALRVPCSTWLHAYSRHRFVSRVQALNEEKEAPAAAPEQQQAALPPTPSTSSSDAPHLPYAAIAGIAGLGAVETAYLTWVKLFGGELVCPTSGCDAVLSSGYAWLFGIPLSVFGFLAYSAVAGLALAGLSQPQLAEGPKGATVRAGLTGGAAMMASVSAVLIYILQTQFAGEPCAWCYLSAGLSTALLVLVLRGLSLRQLQDVAGPSLGAAASTVLALAVSFGSVNQSNADVGEDFYLPFLPPVITTQASDETRQLARQLSSAGAKMYGAFWCSHCFEQKQAFGVQAMADFPYVECYPQGWRRGTQLDKVCADAGIRAFPTWQINGQLIEGELTLDEVAKLVAGADPATAMRPSS